MTSEKSEFINQFTDYLNTNFSRQATDVDYQRNELITVRRLDSLARIFNEDAQNCTAVCLYQSKLYVASNRDTFEYIKVRIQEIIDYITSKLPVRKDSSRNNRDLRKIISSLSGTSRRKIYQRTTGGNRSKSFYYENAYVIADLVNIFTDTDVNIVLIKNHKVLHAELCIMDYLISNDLYKPLSNVDILFGISKLCCKLCACGMNAVGLIARTHYRAIHGNFYNNWILPEFISKDKGVLKRFLGQEAYTIYKSHKNIRLSLLVMIPTQLGITSRRGASLSCLSDSEED